MSEARESRGALGDVGHYTGFGAIWGRTELSRRDRSLAVISFQAALGRQTELRFHIHGGLNHGLRIEEIDETILQVSTYAGASARPQRGEHHGRGGRPARGDRETADATRSAGAQGPGKAARRWSRRAQDLAGSAARSEGPRGETAGAGLHGRAGPGLGLRRCLVAAPALAPRPQLRRDLCPGRAEPRTRARDPLAGCAQPRSHACGDRGDHDHADTLRRLPPRHRRPEAGAEGLRARGRRTTPEEQRREHDRLRRHRLLPRRTALPEPVPVLRVPARARTGVARAASRRGHGHGIRGSPRGLPRHRRRSRTATRWPGPSPSGRFRSRATTSARSSRSTATSCRSAISCPPSIRPSTPRTARCWGGCSRRSASRRTRSSCGGSPIARSTSSSAGASASSSATTQARSRSSSSQTCSAFPKSSTSSSARSSRAATDKPTQGPDGKMTHKPLEFLYERFTKFIEERRREPRDDVMTQMATATFPDGSLPEVHDVMLIASNLFAAGGETTARLLGVMFQLIGERPELQQLLRDERDLHPELRRGVPAARDPDPEHLPTGAGPRTTIGGVQIPAGTTRDAAPRRREPRSAPVRGSQPSSASTVRTGASTSRSGPASTAARARRSRGPRRASAPSACSTAWPTSGSPRRRTARPARAATSIRNHYMLRGLERLHLEFTPIARS